MKRHILALLLSSALVPAAAQAADMPVKAPPVAPLPPPITWTGFYIGANIGGAWSNNDASFTTFDLTPLASGSGSNNTAGVVGGGQLGYNWQINNWLIGFEGDFNGSSQKRSNTFTDVLGGVFDTEAQVQWFATARGRLGYVNGPWLIYATGGGAWVNFKGTITDSVNGTSFSDETTRSGWTVGGGVEWMFLPNWSAKLEYLFIDVGDRTFTDLNGNSLDVKLQENVVRVGVNYHF
jgi:outer membrane immunogenic protein